MGGEGGGGLAVDAKAHVQGTLRRHGPTVTGTPERHGVATKAAYCGGGGGAKVKKAMLVIEAKHFPPLFP